MISHLRRYPQLLLDGAVRELKTEGETERFAGHTKKDDSMMKPMGILVARKRLLSCSL